MMSIFRVAVIGILALAAGLVSARAQTAAGDVEVQSGVEYANHDGVVDAADYVLWRRALQGGGSLNPAVPEPSSVCLIALMFLYFFNYRR